MIVVMVSLLTKEIRRSLLTKGVWRREKKRRERRERRKRRKRRKRTKNRRQRHPPLTKGGSCRNMKVM